MIPPKKAPQSHRKLSHQTRVSDVKGKRKKAGQELISMTTHPSPNIPRQGFHNRKGAGSTCVHAGLTCRWQHTRIIVAHSAPNGWHSTQ